MGGTRMASDASTGVVDANCRLFERPNLYIASSSVFPTSGWANPTLTIIALAERLADHIHSNAALVGAVVLAASPKSRSKPKVYLFGIRLIQGNRAAQVNDEQFCS